MNSQSKSLTGGRKDLCEIPLTASDQVGEENLEQEQCGHERRVGASHEASDGGGVEAVDARDVARTEEGEVDDEQEGEDAGHVRHCHPSLHHLTT